MLIKTEYDIQFHLPIPTPMVAMLHLHPALEPQVLRGNQLRVEHIDRETKTDVVTSEFHDVFGKPLHEVYSIRRRNTAERDESH